MQKLAVIMTYYNESYIILKKAVDSTLQDLERLEKKNVKYKLIIGVDRRNEDIPHVESLYLKEVSARNDVCVVFFNENEGLAASLNKLIFGACNGYDFIA